MIQEAKNQAKSPFERVSRIKAAMIGARAMETSALSYADTILSKVQSLEQGPVAKAKGKFPTNIATEIKEDKNVAALVVVQTTIIALAGGGYSPTLISVLRIYQPLQSGALLFCFRDRYSHRA
ncbi:hypothetical protein [Desulfobacter sp.]|uniref:hypothetical protein n=1 Tax=Desulfobacter sp. TaxID=2294 RepID=UPI003D0CE5C0